MWSIVDSRWSIVFILMLFLCNEAHTEEAFLYNSRGRRDPFVPLVGANVKTVESLEDVMSIEDVKLQGIATDATGNKVAILNGQMVKEGKSEGRITVKKIMQEKVAILIDEDEYELNIYEENVQENVQ